MSATRLQQVVATIGRVLSNPSADPRATALVIGAVAAIVLVLVIAIYLIFTPKQRRIVKTVTYLTGPQASEPGGEGEDEDVPAPVDEEPVRLEPAPKRPLPRWLAWLLGPALVPLLVLAAVVGSYAATSTDDYCARTCHRDQRSVATAEKVSHAACVECHSAPGVAGVAGAVMDRARMVVLWAGGRRPQNVRAVAASSACLRCHRDITKAVRTSDSANVRMRHYEPLAAGMKCFVCHGQLGHMRKRQAVSMSQCIRCHDGKQASADCATCHTTDVSNTEEAGAGRTVGSGKYTYPPVEVSDVGCGGCHDQARQCDTCHKLRMPHPAAFLAGYHARDAAFEKKQLCWRCHVEGDCGKCHIVPFTSGHDPRWKQTHQSSPADSTCACHERGVKLAPGQMCRYCHGPAPSQ